MTRTFITNIPDRAGAFLEASRIVAAAGGKITRVSYNKAVDLRTLFFDVSGTQEQLETIAERLKAIGYITRHIEAPRVILIDFTLPLEVGALLPILELIDRYTFNISYINSQSDAEAGTQDFRMGLYIEQPRDIRRFLQEAADICEVRVMSYDQSEKVLDNTVFYIGFVNSVSKKLKLKRSQSMELMKDANQIMQRLDKLNKSPYKTFDIIGKFIDMIVSYGGEKFRPRITCSKLQSGAVLHLIEPPCGSDTWILEVNGDLLFIDTGFTCYAEEMQKILFELFPDFEHRKRRCIITHPDIDHCGLVRLFDEVYVSRMAYEYFRLENAGEPNFREQKPAHAPYYRMARMASRYLPPDMESLKVIGMDYDDPSAPIFPIGQMEFNGLRFTCYRGNGGHAIGEMIIVDEADKLVFCGDILVNVKGFTKPQDAYNRLAPYMMSSVNMNSPKANEERKAMLTRFNPKEYSYACGHGALLNPGESPR